ncbi:MAG: GNAT family N-acetyltransferase [Polyangiaceae bacterium]|nr:GNAT family N-acetyltransferase [Polyangiaceae bacterium]
MSETTILRRMEARDIELVTQIQEATFEGRHGAATGFTGLQLTEELVRPWSRLWVIEEKGWVHGALIAWHVVDEIHLLNVAVAPGAQRRGLARRLVEGLLSYARDEGAVQIFLEVRVDNLPALALYEAFGFEVLNERKNYYGDGASAYEMRLAISQRPALTP